MSITNIKYLLGIFCVQDTALGQKDGKNPFSILKEMIVYFLKKDAHKEIYGKMPTEKDRLLPFAAFCVTLGKLADLSKPQFICNTEMILTSKQSCKS